MPAVFKCFPSRHLLVALLSAATLLCCPLQSQAARPQKVKLLVINSFHQTFPWSKNLLAGVNEVLSDHQGRIAFITHMDTRGVTDPSYLKNLAEIYRIKYKGKKFDCIITADQAAFEFALKHGQEIFPDTPWVFTGVSSLDGMTMGHRQHMTGVLKTNDIRQTIDEALQLRPKAKAVYVITDNTVEGRALNYSARRQLGGIIRAKVHYLDGRELTTGQMLGKLTKINPNSIVLFSHWYRDAQGQNQTLYGTLSDVVAKSPAPVFGIFDYTLGHGIVGGRLDTGTGQGQAAAKMAMQIVDGAKPGDVPLMLRSTNSFIFDYNQLKRWNIDLAALPTGSTVINKPNTFFDRNKRLITGILIFVAAQSLFIIWLAIINIKKRKAEAELATSRHDLAITLNSIVEAVVATDLEGQVTRMNPVAEELTGWSLAIALNKPLDQVCRLYGELQNDFLGNVTQRIINGSLAMMGDTFILQSADGAQRPVTVSASAIRGPAGRVKGVVMVLRDVSEKRKAAQALRRSEARYRSLYDAMHEGVALYQIVDKTTGDPDFVVLDMNPAFENMLGKPRSQIVGMWCSFALGASMPRVLTALRQVAIDGLPVSFEDDFKELGKSFKAEVFSPSKGLFATVMEDVTEARKAKVELAKSDEKFQKAFFNHPDGVTISRAEDGVFLEVNPGMANLLGYDINELKNQSAIDLGVWAIPEDRDFIYSVIQSQGIFQNVETKFSRKNGTLVPVLLSGALIYFDGQQRVLSICRDITEATAAEEALRRSEEKFQAAFHSSPEGIVILDLESGQIIDVNDGFTRSFGFSREHALSTPRFSIDSWVDDEVRKAFLMQLLENKEVRDFAADMKVHQNQHKNMLISARLLEIDNNLCMICVLRDITELKKAEQAKLDLEDQLRQSQKMEALGTLAGGIAHEFNNILAAIIGHTELAALKLHQNQPADMQIKNILSGAERAKSLTRQILTFSREGRQELNPVRAGQLVRESVELLRASLPSTINIRCDIKNDGVILADQSTLNQVVMNLCTNAAHAMSNGGGTIEVRQSIFQCQEDGQRWLQLEVGDSGDGIRQEIRERIFEPFFTTKKPGEGTGLGLSVVHGIVSGLGGSIQVDDRPGGGTVFIVKLPANEPEITYKETPKNQPTEGNERILLVDDEKQLLKGLGDLLAILGYQVTCFDESRQALEAFEKNPYSFDILITDQTMPGLTGTELAQLVMTIRKDLPIILCTGYSHTVSQEKAAELGISCFLQKPFSHAELAGSIRQVIDKKFNPPTP